MADHLTPEELLAITKALRIGEVSWDGDGWYAKDAGWDYDEAEAAFAAAFAVVKRLAVALTPESTEAEETRP